MSATDAKTDVDTRPVDTSRGLCLDGVRKAFGFTPDRVTAAGR